MNSTQHTQTTERKREVITLASTIKKPTKAHALQIIQDVMNASGDDFGKLDYAELASLYAFFGDRPRKAKTDDQWVSIAVAKKDVRYYITCAYSDGKRLFGTDGHRLHWIPTDKPDGFYDAVSLEPVNVSYKYPDVDRLIPDRSRLRTVTCRASGLEVVDSGWTDKRKGKTRLAYKMPSGGHLLKTYLDEALSGASEFECNYAGPMDSILIQFKDSDRQAVIMPVRV